MKVLILFILISSQAYAQEPFSAIELSDFNILYRSYKNRVKFAISNDKGCEMNIICQNCEIEKSEVFENSYYVIPGSKSRAYIELQLLDEDSTVVYSHQTEFRVRNLPNPTIYWGPSKNGSKGTLHSKVLLAKYPPEVPLNSIYQVRSWTMYIDGEENISGEGSNIGTAVEYLKTLEGEKQISFMVNVVGPDGITRQIYASYPVACGPIIEHKTHVSNGCG